MMDRKELIVDLRGKLSPIKNYLEMQRELESLQLKDVTTGLDGFIEGMRFGKLQVLVQEEKRKAEKAMSQVELIIELLERS